MREKDKRFYMDVAIRAAELSYCERRKVGAVIVKDGAIISHGYNGTLPGDLNVCEDEDFITKDNVLHAEENAIAKVAGSSYSTRGGAMFITMAPCLKCVRLMIQCGITEVYYQDSYRDDSGLLKLIEKGIRVEQIEINDPVAQW